MLEQPSEGDYIEKKLRKMNQMAIDTGFGPLNVNEIEAILMRVSPPSPINDAEPKENPIPGVLSALAGDQVVNPNGPAPGSELSQNPMMNFMGPVQPNNQNTLPTYMNDGVDRTKPQGVLNGWT